MMTFRQWMWALLTWSLVLQPTANADPCGMVPPIWTGSGQPIVRVGAQKTYVFHKDGIESIVLRPGFSGRVEDFGMLIPFPSPPAIRKVSEDVFAHVAAAVDPPEVVANVNGRAIYDFSLGAALSEDSLGVKSLRRGQVVVLREEAVGMYEVAVLAAGGAEALKEWMDGHGYRYPEGMDVPCNEYVAQGWCFVAVKARVGRKAPTEPRPGMRDADSSLRPGDTFDGHVQAMGFRFRTEEMVVPMRLSAFNPGELHNVVYILCDGPRKIAGIPERFVRRQVPGWQLRRNLTQELPLRVVGGKLEDLPEWRRNALPHERDPFRSNGIAKELFASDLLAVAEDRLAHPHEETAKELTNIGEELRLRGVFYDGLVREEVKEQRARMIRHALEALDGMTLTVVDGVFEREVLARDDLRFPPFTMSAALNTKHQYDAVTGAPFQPVQGTLYGGPPAFSAPVLLAAALALALIALARRRRGGARSFGALPVALALLVGAGVVVARGEASRSTPQESQPVPDELTEAQKALLERLRAELEVELRSPPGSTIILGPRVGVPQDWTLKPDLRLDLPGIESQLQGQTAENEDHALAVRGRAIVELARLADAHAKEVLRRLRGDPSALVRVWATAALVRSADARELAQLTPALTELAALTRPISLRWRELLSADPGTDLAFAFGVIGATPQLRDELLPFLLDLGPDPFADQLFTAENDEGRRLAAGCLATLDQRSPDGSTAAAVLRRTYFLPHAEQVPWHGGALFVPGLKWEPATARQLATDLLSWMIWCEVRGLGEEVARVHANLRSVALARPAGYASPGGRHTDARQWLGIWERAYGRGEVLRLLALQGLGEEWWRGGGESR